MKLMTSRNALLVATSLIELGAGVTLMCVPLEGALLLTGAALEGAAVATMTRVAGAAVIALGVACLVGSYDAYGLAAKGLIAAMSIYNFTAASIFVWAGVGAGLNGLALWAAAILHSVMFIWCISCLRHSPVTVRG